MSDENGTAGGTGGAGGTEVTFSNGTGASTDTANITDMFSGAQTLAGYKEPEKPAPAQAKPVAEKATQDPQITAPVVAPQEQPPQEQVATPPQWFQQQMQFQQQQAAENAARHQAQIELYNRHFSTQQALLQQAQQQRMERAQQEKVAAFQAQRQASMPKAPDPATATVDDMIKWQQNYADWSAKSAREDATQHVTEKIQQLEQMVKTMDQQVQQRAIQEQAAREDQYLDQTVNAFASDPRYSFMKDPDLQRGFLGHWWAVNQTSIERTGKGVDPNVAMNDYMRTLHRAHQVLGTSPQRAQAQANDQQKRIEQQKRGMQPTLGTAPTSSPQARAEQERKSNMYQQMFGRSWADDPGMFKS